MSITNLFVAAQVALSSKKGAAMVEYALLAALVAVVAATTLTTLGTSISSKFSAIAGSI
ncbi:MAG: Flp family type IVb pilin [Acetobacteraceae bacterium]|nr:Flp family type IVb pilin [Acetobacteraceae bacterium]